MRNRRHVSFRMLLECQTVPMHPALRLRCAKPVANLLPQLLGLNIERVRRRELRRVDIGDAGHLLRELRMLSFLIVRERAHERARIARVQAPARDERVRGHDGTRREPAAALNDRALLNYSAFSDHALVLDHAGAQHGERADARVAADDDVRWHAALEKASCAHNNLVLEVRERLDAHVVSIAANDHGVPYACLESCAFATTATVYARTARGHRARREQCISQYGIQDRSR